MFHLLLGALMAGQGHTVNFAFVLDFRPCGFFLSVAHDWLLWHTTSAEGLRRRLARGAVKANDHVEHFTNSSHIAHTRTDSERYCPVTRETWVYPGPIQADVNKRAVDVDGLRVLLAAARLILLVHCARRARCALSCAHAAFASFYVPRVCSIVQDTLEIARPVCTIPF